MGAQGGKGAQRFVGSPVVINWVTKMPVYTIIYVAAAVVIVVAGNASQCRNAASVARIRPCPCPWPLVSIDFGLKRLQNSFGSCNSGSRLSAVVVIVVVVVSHSQRV